MARKRRMFDIEMPDEPGADRTAAEAEAEERQGRRGPMASAVRENAESLRERAEAEAAIRAENDALAHEYVRLREEGLVLRRIPLGQIAATKLPRDRRSGDDEALEELTRSIRAIGLSNPVQVEETGAGYQLIQGLRRLAAFRMLAEETGEARYATIPAVVLQEGEAIEALYRRMVDENLIRKDISFAEMAALARDYAADPRTGAQDLDEAVTRLYGSGTKQRRSYIRAFAELLDEIGPALRHPEAVPRDLGLAVRRHLAGEPSRLAGLLSGLREAATAEEELAVLQAFAGGAEGAFPAGNHQARFPAGNHQGAAGQRLRQPRMTFQVSGPQGAARCTAGAGRLELRLDTDFSAMDRRRLEEAVRRFLDDLS